ncbi:chorismate synthase [Oribacterium sp. P6A1]|uniref:chorismate synthase n=1 Tax=Oribacterium sp. P6A1 TaxID=1410612 RepID=UPI0005606223|nr:chorismate synthase [Oribacterium sp. P6A1]
MAGNTFGKLFRITTFGESHGPALGVVIDGCPAGLQLSEADIQPYMDRRKPGQNQKTTARKEEDRIEILSGVFEGITTGTPIAMIVRNSDQHSKDYSDIAHVFRPGHADYGFFQKYGLRDYRGGGRSSGRETLARVAGGAVAAKVLSEIGITVDAEVTELAGIDVTTEAGREAADARILELKEEQDSAGGVVTCFVNNMPTGIGEPVFDKLDANLAKAVMSIGAVKAVEIGDGTKVSRMRGSENNDGFEAVAIEIAPDEDDEENEDIEHEPSLQEINNFRTLNGLEALDEAEYEEMLANGEFDGTEEVFQVTSNHAGGILGGMSDGAEIVLRAYFKPTPSIARPQKTANEEGDNVTISIKGRHDPTVVERANVVVECMVAITILDSLLENMGCKMDNLREIYPED